MQQALPSNTTVTANYVGSRGHRLDVNINGNQATTPAVAGTPIPTTSCVRNPSCVAQLAARFPLPYAFVTHYDVSAGKSWYDALQVSVDKKDLAVVAKAWLQSVGLLSGGPAAS